MCDYKADPLIILSTRHAAAPARSTERFGIRTRKRGSRLPRESAVTRPD
jgi:hypothetical protein